MNGTKQTISLNGRLYDAITGAPIAGPHTEKPAPAHHAPHKAPHTPQDGHHHKVNAHHVHQTPQKSQTLYRAALKRPVSTSSQSQPHHASSAARPTVKHQHRSPVITRFAPQPASKHLTARPPASKAEVGVKPPRQHPLVQRVLAGQQAYAPQPVEVPSPQFKEHLIRQQLAAARPNSAQAQETKKTLFTHRPRLATVLSASLAMLILGGYLAYFNLPNISMRVAATRAGIAASLPEYKPEGYRFAGPITYAPGEVSTTYKAEASGAAYTIKQKTSNWDSQAVLQNYVTRQSRVYLTYQEHGLTIYSFGNSAAWVNGGVLYTIDGNAPLSSEQLLNIATSM